MTPTDIIWLFFMFSALQPVLKQRFLEGARRALIAKIERQRNSRVILLVHRQETMSILGFLVFRYIDVNDSEEVPFTSPIRRCRWTSCCTPQAVWCSPRCRSPAPFTSIAAR